MTDAPHDQSASFPNDMISEGRNIALFMFRQYIEEAAPEEREKVIKKYTRKVYHLAETSRLPVFRLGSTLNARKSVLKNYIDEQQKRNASKTIGFEDPENTNE